MLTIGLDYDTSAAGYADDDIRISVYDVTNATLIRVNGEDLKAGFGTHYAQFQTAPDSTSYRLIIHQSSVSALAYDVFFDNLSVGPNIIAKAAEIGEVGEILTMAENISLVGPYLYCDGAAISRTIYAELFSALGTTYGVGDGSTTFNLPDYRDQFLRGDSGARTVGSTQADATAKNGLTASSVANGTHQHTQGSSIASNASYDPHHFDYGSSADGTIPVALSGGSSAAKKPWVSSEGSHSHTITVGAGDTETRPANIGVRYYIRYKTDRVVSADLGNNNDGIGEVITFATAATPPTFALYCDGAAVSRTIYKRLFDIIGTAYGVGDGSTTFNIPDYRDQFFRGDSGARTVGTTQADATARNGLTASSGTQSANHTHDQYATADFGGATGILGDANVGSTRVTAIENTGSNSASHTHAITIGAGDSETRPANIGVRYYIRYKGIGQQTVLDTSTVAARYTTASAQVFANGVNEDILYDTIDFDTHNAMDILTGIYTAPVTGFYTVSYRATLNTQRGAGEQVSLRLRKNGTLIQEDINEAGSIDGTTNYLPTKITDVIYLEKGDGVKASLYQDIFTTEALVASDHLNVFSIAKNK